MGQVMQVFSVPCWWVGWWLGPRGLYLARHLFTLLYHRFRSLLCQHRKTSQSTESGIKGYYRGKVIWQHDETDLLKQWLGSGLKWFSVQYLQNMEDVSLWTNEILSSCRTMSAAPNYYALQMKHQWNIDDLIFSQYEIGNGLDRNDIEVEIDNPSGFEK